MRTLVSVTAIIFAVLILLVNLGTFTVSTTMANPADPAIHGNVTDAAGKPIRGATVKVALGTKAISRFTDQNGRYLFTGLQTGNYRVTVQVYGYETKSQTQDANQTGETNFLLKPRWSTSQLSGAELMTALPENDETRFMYAHCTSCHTMVPMLLKKGLTASEWDGVAHGMAEKSIAKLGLNPLPESPILARMTELLEKYLGPNSHEMTQDQVKHVAITDAALQGTFYEFDIPSPNSFPHGIHADNHGDAWFDEFDVVSNSIGKLNLETGEVTEYRFPDAGPMAPRIDKDGKVMVSLRRGRRVASLDPLTGQSTIIAEGAPGARKGTFDKEGNFWGSGGDGVYEFNRLTKKFQDYPGPALKEIPEDSLLAFGKLPGASNELPAHMPGGGSGPGPLNPGSSYDVAVDSKDRVWYTTYMTGTLVRLDPETGKNATFNFPGVPSARGVAVDSKDNLWYADVYGFKLVKFDQKTDKGKLYQPPTRYASPYGVVAEKNGNIWYADYTGNNITRFDPKTEQFTEYPIPTRSAMPRFISVDDQGRVWFTEWWQGKVGVLVPAGGSKPATASLK